MFLSHIYKLVSEANKVKDPVPEDLLGEGDAEDEYLLVRMKRSSIWMQYPSRYGKALTQSKMKAELVDKGMEPEDAQDHAVNHYGFDPDDVDEYIARKDKEKYGYEDVTIERVSPEDPKAQALIRMLKDPNIDKQQAIQINSRYRNLQVIPSGFDKNKFTDESMGDDTYGFEKLADEIVDGAEFNREPVSI